MRVSLIVHKLSYNFLSEWRSLYSKLFPRGYVLPLRPMATFGKPLSVADCWRHNMLRFFSWRFSKFSKNCKMYLLVRYVFLTLSGSINVKECLCSHACSELKYESRVSYSKFPDSQVIKLINEDLGVNVSASYMR